jgi:flavodoxin
VAKVVILVGTMYGNALEAAKACSAELTKQGHLVRIAEAPTLVDLIGEPDSVPLICTSSTGMGDLPDSIMPLYCQLLDDSPALGLCRYGLIGLGDSSYDNFNGGARTLDALFQDLGAQRLGEPLFVDASVDYEPEKPAAEWVKGWAKLLG